MAAQAVAQEVVTVMATFAKAHLRLQILAVAAVAQALTHRERAGVEQAALGLSLLDTSIDKARYGTFCKSS
jgi:hypothetical protein